MMNFNSRRAKSQRSAHGDVVRRDAYKMDRYPNNFFDYVLDIGANGGVFSLFAHMRHPQAQIFAYEPCKEMFEFLVEHTFYVKNIHCHNEAFGNGCDLRFVDTGHLLASEFFQYGEGDYEKGSYSVPSYALTDMFDRHAIPINSKYMIKMDCEGGERFLLEEGGECTRIIRSACVFGMEVHFPTSKRPEVHRTFPTWEVWQEWVYGNFSLTHEIIYHMSSRHRGYGMYVLIKKGVF